MRPYSGDVSNLGKMGTCDGYGSFTLMETDSDSDSKPDGYIVLCRTFSHCTDPDHYSYFCLGQESKFESVSESVSGNVNEPLHE